MNTLKKYVIDSQRGVISASDLNADEVAVQICGENLYKETVYRVIVNKYGKKYFKNIGEIQRVKQ